MTITSSVLGDIAAKNHTSDQGKTITQLVWQKSQNKEVGINSTGYSVGDSIDVCLVNPKYKLSINIVLFLEFIGPIIFEPIEKNIVNGQIDKTGQPHNTTVNMQIVAENNYMKGAILGFAEIVGVLLVVDIIYYYFKRI